ncbi:hypothetical protein HYS48_02430 [Candidatus Woesearchaeota archaeon]|nr:hypothetical protein [Candidatus Woesearchaeota archaeon]
MVQGKVTRVAGARRGSDRGASVPYGDVRFGDKEARGVALFDGAQLGDTVDVDPKTLKVRRA